MAASAPPAYPDDKQWSNAREVVFVVPQQDGAGGAVANVAGGHHGGGGGHQSPPAAPSNSSLAAVKKEMGILTRVCESLLEYIQAQIDTAFHGEYPGKEAWLSVVATVRDQVAAMEDAAKSYGLYMNLANINEQEGEELKVPTVRLLERVKRTLELLEKGRVVEKNAIKNGLFGKKTDKEYHFTDDDRIKTYVSNIRAQIDVENLDMKQFKVSVERGMGGVVRFGGYVDRDIVNVPK